jgi:hypothetical protein
MCAIGRWDPERLRTLDEKTAAEIEGTVLGSLGFGEQQKLKNRLALLQGQAN